MSTNFYLINDETQTIYYLGQSAWFFLQEEIEAVKDLEYLEELLFGDVYRGYEPDSTRPRSWSAMEAAEIFDFCKDTPLENLRVVRNEEFASHMRKGYRPVVSPAKEAIAEQQLFLTLYQPKKEKRTLRTKLFMGLHKVRALLLRPITLSFSPRRLTKG